MQQETNSSVPRLSLQERRVTRCSSQCQCGTKKTACKNKEEERQVIYNNNPSAFVRHQQAVEAAQQEIEVRNRYAIQTYLYKLLRSSCARLRVILL